MRDRLLCEHVLKVMVQLNVNLISDKYLFERWTLKGSENARKQLVPMNVNKVTSRKLKYVHICKKSVHMVNEACKIEYQYRLALQDIEDLTDQLTAINLSQQHALALSPLDATMGKRYMWVRVARYHLEILQRNLLEVDQETQQEYDLLPLIMTKLWRKEGKN